MCFPSSIIGESVFIFVVSIDELGICFKALEDDNFSSTIYVPYCT